MKYKEVFYPTGKYVVPDTGSLSALRKLQAVYFLKVIRGVFQHAGESVERFMFSPFYSHVDSVLAWNADMARKAIGDYIDPVSVYSEDRDSFAKLVDEFVDGREGFVVDACSKTISLMENTAKENWDKTNKISKIAEIFALSKEEHELLFFLVCFRESVDINDFFDVVSDASGIDLADLLSYATGGDKSEAARAFSAGHKFFDNYMIEGRASLLDGRRVFSPWLDRFFKGIYGSDIEMEKVFFSDEFLPRFVDGDFAHLEEDSSLLSRLLESALAVDAKGVNILIAGGEASAKIDYAHAIANAVGRSRIVNSNGSVGVFESPLGSAITYAASHYAPGDKAIIIFDTVDFLGPGDAWRSDSHDEDFLRSAFGARIQKCKSVVSRWMQNALENNPRPAIWLCDRVADLDKDVLARFSAIVELPAIPAETLLSKSISSSCSYIDKEEIRSLVEARIDPALIDSGLKAIELIRPSPEKAVELLKKHIAKAANVGLSRASRASNKNKQYSFEFCNIGGKLSVDRVISGLKSNMSQRVLFYGAPGTGKTMLALNIAQRLQSPLRVVKYSDIQSKYLGEGEARLAAAFKDARDAAAILFFDEVDSFLMDRRTIPDSAPWLRSFVNEFLQEVECFDGLVLCATNFLESLDSAVIRRFSLKVGFDYLTGYQVLKLFERYTNICSIDDVSEQIRSRLKMMKFLTPGDFSVVSERAEIIGGCSALEFLEMLEEEHSIKAGRFNSRPIGFVY